MGARVSCHYLPSLSFVIVAHLQASSTGPTHPTDKTDLSPGKHGAPTCLPGVSAAGPIPAPRDHA